MSGPDRIFTKSWKHATHSEVGVWSATHHVGTTEYIRRDPAVLAALPEVQAIVDAAVEIARATAFVLGREAGEKAERESCARLVDCGCDKRQKAAVIEAKTSAERARACGQYNCGAEDAAAIRKRVED